MNTSYGYGLQLAKDRMNDAIREAQQVGQVSRALREPTPARERTAQHQGSSPWRQALNLPAALMHALIG